MIIGLLILSFIWAMFEGRREAQYFHFKWQNPTPTPVADEHIEFTIQRSLYVLVNTVASWVYAGWVSSLILTLGIVLGFSFFHNGSYYLRRNQLDSNIYTRKWLDSSTTTTAKFSFNFLTRTVMLGATIILIVTYYLLKLK